MQIFKRDMDHADTIPPPITTTTSTNDIQNIQSTPNVSQEQIQILSNNQFDLVEKEDQMIQAYEEFQIKMVKQV